MILIAEVLVHGIREGVIGPNRPLRQHGLVQHHQLLGMPHGQKTQQDLVK